METRDRLRHGFAREDWFYPEEIGDYVAGLATGNNGDQNQLVHYLLHKKQRASAAEGS